MSDDKFDFSFLKGEKDLCVRDDSEQLDFDKSVDIVKEQLGEAINASHVSFLLGSGCSSHCKNGDELGIPTMVPMAKKFFCENKISEESKDKLFERFGINICEEEYQKNLERLLEILFSAKFSISEAKAQELRSVGDEIDKTIKAVKKHILNLCSQGNFGEDKTVLNLYKEFYQKLLFRDKALERPWIFTTNYDLFNEKALDGLSIPYCNGFSGVVERKFNPSIYRYSLAEQIDISNKKWTSVDNFVYLCKLHGSINWVSIKDEVLFPIKELQGPNQDMGNSFLIYPTPAKHKASFESPYTDLFREFQKQIVRDQSVLFTIGYSFGDDHINNIIFQALTIPNFRLIAFLPTDASGMPEKIKNLKDPRIWLIGSEDSSVGEKAHYFNTFIKHFMPGDSDSTVNKFITAAKQLIKHST